MVSMNWPCRCSRSSSSAETGQCVSASARGDPLLGQCAAITAEAAAAI